jgi:spore coat polysaccharide biosynthesis protein SpsF
MRLPGKVLLPLNGRPAIYRIISRVKKCKSLLRIYLATSQNSENTPLVEIADKEGCGLYRGSENDVLSRFVDIVKQEGPDIVVRISADNFAIDPNVIEHGIKKLLDENLDICTAFINNSYPFGAGAEVSTSGCLLRIDSETKGKDVAYREHIYTFAYGNQDKYRIGTLKAPKGLRRPDINISVDSKKDYEKMKLLYEKLKNRESNFTTAELIKAWDSLL